MFDPSDLSRRLSSLNITQTSISQLSNFIQSLEPADVQQCVTIWCEHFSQTNPEKQLVLLYLVNDILQNTRKQDKLFSTAFSVVLPVCIALLLKKSESESIESLQKIKPKIERLLLIWKDRHLFDKEWYDKLSEECDLDLSDSNAVVQQISRRGSVGEKRRRSETPKDEKTDEKFKKVEYSPPPTPEHPTGLSPNLNKTNSVKLITLLNQIDEIELRCRDLESKIATESKNGKPLSIQLKALLKEQLKMRQQLLDLLSERIAQEEERIESLTEETTA